MELTLFCGFGNETPVIQAFLSRFAPRIPDAAEFAEERRVILLKTSEGIPIDVALAGFPFEESLCRRAVLREFLPGISLQVCQADDLVVLKAFAGRSKDWMDIENVLVRQGDRLDWDYILKELKPLVELKEAPEAWSDSADRSNDDRRNDFCGIGSWVFTPQFISHKESIKK